jgi:hypothetical protein
MIYLLCCFSSERDWQAGWNHIVNRAGDYWIHPVAVDFSGERTRDEEPPYWFHSIAEAQAHPAFAGYTWVWLTAEGDTYLDEYPHPADNVVYCIGDNVVGFQGGMGDGPRLKVRPMNPEIPDNAEHPAELVADILIFDRFMYINGKRL